MGFFDGIREISRGRKRAVILAIDSVLIALSLGAAIGLQSVGIRPITAITQSWTVFPVAVLVGGLVSIALGIPKTKLKAYESRAIVQTGVFAVVLSLSLGAVGGIENFLPAKSLSLPDLPTAVFVVFGLLFFSLSVTSRIVGLQALLWVYRQGQERTRILIYGAGATGVQLVAALRQSEDIEPVAFVDDNKTLQGMMVAGLPVRAPVDFPRMLDELRIARVVLAMPSLSHPRQAQIAKRVEALGCSVQHLPSFSELIGNRDIAEKLEPLPASDYLERDLIDREFPKFTNTYAGKTVLVTGAGGSIGSELCRQVIACNPAAIVLFDQSEAALYTIDMELRTLVAGQEIDIVPVIGSVCDRALLDYTLARAHVDIILHAAAHKHVPLVEANEVEGLRNNVFGTKVLADASLAAGVERFVQVSSDKAVRPSSVMGAAKRMAEMVIQDLASRSSSTLFSMVRFGNVLGSSGSVVPLFQEQILRGGPVTLTHKDITRYFMTSSEAARLVLVAGSFSRGGDVFVLDMGAPVPIARLARRMIERSGYTVRNEKRRNGDIEIVVTGLRQGEKLYEELLIGADMQTTPHPKILRAKETSLSEIEVANMLRDLNSVVGTHDNAAARDLIARWVGGYQPSRRHETR